MGRKPWGHLQQRSVSHRHGSRNTEPCPDRRWPSRDSWRPEYDGPCWSTTGCSQIGTAEHARSAAQPHNLAPIGTLLARFPNFRRSPASTLRSTGGMILVDHYAIPSDSMCKAFAAMAFMVSLRICRSVFGTWRPPPQKAVPSLPILEAEPRCVLFAREGASTALLASRPLTGFRWGRGQGSSTRRGDCTS